MLITIIVPVYNKLLFLQDCLDSLLRQTYGNYEIILIDDGSTDNSGTICDRYADIDKRIRVYHIPNQGVSVARNKGLDEAKGEYVCFVDADDWVRPDWLDVYIREIKYFPYDLIYTEMQREKEGVKPYKISLPNFSAKCIDDVVTGLIVLFRNKEFGFMCNKCFKKSLIDIGNVRFSVGTKLHEDALFTSDYCKYINSLCIRPEATYHYRITDDSISVKLINHWSFEEDIEIWFMVSQQLLQLHGRLEIQQRKKIYALCADLVINCFLDAYNNMYGPVSRKNRIKYLRLLHIYWGYTIIVNRDFKLFSRLISSIINLKRVWLSDFLLMLVYRIRNFFRG